MLTARHPSAPLRHLTMLYKPITVILKVHPGDPPSLYVKRILRKHGHPPDKQEKATRTVLEQPEVLCEGPSPEPRRARRSLRLAP